MLDPAQRSTFIFEFIRLNILLFDTKQQLIRLCTEYLATESEHADQSTQDDKIIDGCASKRLNVDLTIKTEVEIEGTQVKSEILNDLDNECLQSDKEFQGKDVSDHIEACKLKVEVNTEREIEVEELVGSSELNDFPVLRCIMSPSSDRVFPSEYYAVSTSNTIKRNNQCFRNKPLLPIGILQSPTNNDEQDMENSPKLEEYSETEVSQSLNTSSESALETNILTEDSVCYKTLSEMGSSTTSIQKQDTIALEDSKDPHHSGSETVLPEDSLPFPNLNEQSGLQRERNKNRCYYCEAEVSNFARHMYRHHPTEREVQEILARPASSKRRKELLTDLRKLGNFKKLKPVRKHAGNSYLPCPHCLGLYSRKSLWKHTKSCPKNTTKRTGKSQIEGQNVLVKNVLIDPQLREFVFPRMRPDKVSLVAKKDILICSYAAECIKLHRKKNFAYMVSRKMRELGKVLIFLQNAQQRITSLFHALKPQYYDLLVEATKAVAQYDVNKEFYKSPTFAINFGSALKRCCEIALSNVLKRKSVYGTNVKLKAEDDINTLKDMISANWRHDVSSHACQDLNINKGNKVTLVPIISTASNINDKQNDINKNQNNEINEKKNYRIVKGKRRVLVPWTEEQKKLVNTFFEQHIQAKKPPKQRECEELRSLHPDILRNKDWLKIKVFVQNKYSK